MQAMKANVHVVFPLRTSFFCTNNVKAIRRYITTYITTRVELMFYPNNRNDYLFIIKRLICPDVETMLVQVYIIGLLATISHAVQ